MVTINPSKGILYENETHGGFSGDLGGFFGDSSGNYPQMYDRARITRLYQGRIPSDFDGELPPRQTGK